MTTQSGGLSLRHLQMSAEGRHLTDDSAESEATLHEALHDIVAYATKQVAAIGGTIRHVKSISLYECQEYFERVGGPKPNPENKTVCMRPDGGVIIATVKGKDYPLFLGEDKVQGTNDNLFAQGKKKQALGNAIERGAKNIRGAEMLFAGMRIFPYVLFASGCDFHSSESIAKRIEMMNMGVPNHSIYLSKDTTAEEVAKKVDTIADAIRIQKVCGIGTATVLVKAHKYDEMPHGASRWTKPEIVRLCCKVIDLAIKEIS